MQKRKKEESLARLELIIAILGFYILAFGIAGYFAADGVQLGFKLLQSPTSLASITTEDGLFTDEGIVSFSRIRGIINNLQLFTYSAIIFGGIVLAAFAYRLKKRLKVVRFGD